ncbi:MAG: GntR family transcriptional regulator, partial [Oscillospiraceae bacterium]|nr:GntR family transcriptional regulator [Oscillospiraceae bacterium]
MAGKIEQVIDYIAQLEPGAKVSVRSLAQALDVSEGTAYKSIKAAEAQGLVFTRPKVGTVRINLRDARQFHGTTLSEAARSVGAVPPRRELRWTMLFHDLGKPLCFTVDEAGVGHFYGH